MEQPDELDEMLNLYLEELATRRRLLRACAIGLFVVSPFCLVAGVVIGRMS